MIVDVGRSRTPLRAARGTDAFPVAGIVRHLDWILLVAVAALVGYGLWAIGGITRFDVAGDPGYYVRRQGIAAALGGIGMIVMFAVPTGVWRRHWRIVYIATIAVMLFVFAFTEAIRGSKRWIELGPFQFQPSEFGKLFFVLALAGYIVGRRDRLGLRSVLSTVALAVAPIGLVFLQPDLGTALVYMAALSAILFLAGTRWRVLAFVGSSAVLLAVSVVWLLPASGVQILKPYQVERLVGFADAEHDPSGITYNVNQSMTAIGAGGLSGRGVDGASQTRLSYLPEHNTDFVFASFSEQRGFLGAALLLLLYLLVVWRGLRVVTMAGDLYGAVVAGGIVVAFAFQVFVNVGMTMGVAPVTGIPLPFVTVGGSSMVANLIGVGVLQSIHARGRAGRKLR